MFFFNSPNMPSDPMRELEKEMINSLATWITTGRSPSEQTIDKCLEETSKNSNK